MKIKLTIAAFAAVSLPLGFGFFLFASLELKINRQVWLSSSKRTIYASLTAIPMPASEKPGLRLVGKNEVGQHSM